ncbi:hypothetical protein ABZX73_15845, partial [Brevibacterium casei]
MSKARRTTDQLRGQLMLQIAAGRFFRPGVPLHETEHRHTVYTNALFSGDSPITLPVGEVIASTQLGSVSTAMLSVVDRHEKLRPDGTNSILVATSGMDLIDDLAYVMTFALNRTVSRHHNQTMRLVTGHGAPQERSANDLFPGLFQPRQIVRADQLDDLRRFMSDLLMLSREDFGLIMRAIRVAVDATRRAIDDPTGAYTDLVAALESIADGRLSTPTCWQRFDGRKRKIIDAALADLEQRKAESIRQAVIQAERLGLKRRFISSTLARITPDYYRQSAVGTIRPPRSPDLERMLAIAYDIRSRRSHVLQNLGTGVWLSAD